MPQLTFCWPPETSYASEDFIISESNQQAVNFLDNWPAGNQYAALLIGQPASGKTHLLQRWAQHTDAKRIDREALGKIVSADLWAEAHYAILEDIDTITDNAALFHLLRHTEIHGLHLLMSSRLDAMKLAVALPDLRSRLLALPATHLMPPDETLLDGFLMKYFVDRQMRVGEDVIAYVAKRVERSFASALALAQKIEYSSNESRREITIPLVRSLMEAA